ncbi:hypothetical protein FACS1894198_2950 [Clostridia bacterium]|nr:hypothetical protein FACS1894198_2950 [Clostridia bacterium]
MIIHPIKDKYPQYYPVADNNSKILILGSFPSKDWTTGGFYYGSPQNRFWHLIVSLLDEKYSITDFDYSQIAKDSDIDLYVRKMNADEKATLLLNNNIALWDIVDECAPSDDWPSEDYKIIEPKLNYSGINSLLETHRKISKVLFTGKSDIKKQFAEELRKMQSVEIDFLPSPTCRVISQSGQSDKWLSLLTTA